MAGAVSCAAIDRFRRSTLRHFLFAAVSASIVLAGTTAFAQGLPAGTQPPVYGSIWAANKLQADNAIAASQRANQLKDGQASVHQTADVIAVPPTTSR
jgi:hypothetical protein